MSKFSVIRNVRKAVILKKTDVRLVKEENKLKELKAPTLIQIESISW